MHIITEYEKRAGKRIDRDRAALMIGEQRLRDLADDADRPVYGAFIVRSAIDWFDHPDL